MIDVDEWTMRGASERYRAADLQGDRAEVLSALHGAPLTPFVGRRWYTHARAPVGIMDRGVALRLDVFGHEAVSEDELQTALRAEEQGVKLPGGRYRTVYMGHRARELVLRSALHAKLHENRAICGWCVTGLADICPRHAAQKASAS